MYVCICKGITESELLKLADTHAANLDLASDAGGQMDVDKNLVKETVLSRASTQLGVGTGCGRCLEFAEGIVDQQVDQRASLRVSA